MIMEFKFLFVVIYCDFNVILWTYVSELIKKAGLEWLEHQLIPQLKWKTLRLV